MPDIESDLQAIENVPKQPLLPLRCQASVGVIDAPGAPIIVLQLANDAIPNGIPFTLDIVGAAEIAEALAAASVDAAKAAQKLVVPDKRLIVPTGQTSVPAQ